VGWEFLGSGGRIHLLLQVTCSLTVDKVAYICYRTLSAVNVVCKKGEERKSMLEEYVRQAD